MEKKKKAKAPRELNFLYVVVKGTQLTICEFKKQANKKSPNYFSFQLQKTVSQKREKNVAKKTLMGYSTKDHVQPGGTLWS